jgi:CRP-like cAMP-binding protein
MSIREEAQALSEVPLFARLDPSQLELIAFASQLLDFNTGETLFQGGDQSDSVYVVLSGTVESVLETDAGTLVTTELGPHDLVGEMGVFRKAPRSASVRAASPVKVLCIKAEAFLSFLSDNPAEARHVMCQLSEKLAQCHRQLETLHASSQRASNSDDGPGSTRQPNGRS